MANAPTKPPHPFTTTCPFFTRRTTMAQRIYVVTQGEAKRLIRAANPAVARSHVAKSTISVEVASPDDTFELALAGVASKFSIAHLFPVA